MAVLCKYKIGNEEFEEVLTPMKAIRKHCLDCSCGSSYEVAKCNIKDCALYNFRFGKGVSGRKLSEEYKQKLNENLKKARKIKFD